MTPITSSSSPPVHGTTLRNAFLAGVCSSSLLWGFTTWCMRRIPTSKQQHTLSEKGHEKDRDHRYGQYEYTDEDENDRGYNECSSTTNIRSLPIVEEFASKVENDHNDEVYNPWKAIEGEVTASIQYRQLLELRTSLIEQSKRTSLLLLDKILSQTKRIGELPAARKRIRWPWESLRRHQSKEASDDDRENQNSSWSKSMGVGLNPSDEWNGDESEKEKNFNSNAQNFPSRGAVSSNVNGLGDRNMRPRCGTEPDFGNLSSDDSQTTSEHQGVPFSSSNISHSYSQYTASSTETKAEICIGSIFGLDVGGTLSKLVYFETKKEGKINNESNRRESACDAMGVPRAQSSRAMNASFSHSPMRKNTVGQSPPTGFGLGSSRASASYDYSMDDLSVETSWSQQQQPHIPEEKKIKRSLSLFDITSKKAKREQALERFYEFARRLDTYDSEVKDKSLSFYSRALGGEFHFIQFETRHLSKAMDLIKFNDLHLDISRMGATGGGAHKYADEWERYLGIEIAKQDELDSLVAGMQFTLSDVVGECYTFKPQTIRERSSSVCTEDTNDGDSQKSVPKYKVDQYWWSRKVKRDFVAKSDSYPYLLVMIGTGVSVLRVDGPRKHERISGSTIGGGTYWGLCRLLTDVEDFESVLSLAERGDPSKVDMMVGDIYGKESDALDKLGLTANIVASSFGKLVAKTDPADGLKQEDLARALLLMVTNNIGQVAYLNAQLHNTKRIYFVGNFLRHNNLSQRRLAYAINYWSKGKMEALFLEHEGYYGALGSFLLHQGISNDRDGKVAQSKDGPFSIRGDGKTSKRGKKQRSMSL